MLTNGLLPHRAFGFATAVRGRAFQLMPAYPRVVVLRPVLAASLNGRPHNIPDKQNIQYILKRSEENRKKLVDCNKKEKVAVKKEVAAKKEVDTSDAKQAAKQLAKKKKAALKVARAVSRAATLVKAPRPLTSLPEPRRCGFDYYELDPDNLIATWKPLEAYDAGDMAFVYILAIASQHDWGHIAKLFRTHRKQYIAIKVCMKMVALVEAELKRRHEKKHPPPPMPPPVPADTPARDWNTADDEKLCRMWTDQTPLPRIAGYLRRTELQFARCEAIRGRCWGQCPRKGCHDHRA
ncbi:hypothetical protein BDZ88DRAFT_455766 [Geranomyces variabilis]|nr:hypothetical protein BDZ88DRAFT_455766 [Geranomyces variabilis]KAJ3132788.1 hypothetical protein HDU90_006676 [Geranomyces variabilis]